MTSEMDRKKVNKPKAVSGGLVGGISYPAVLHFLDKLTTAEADGGYGWVWLEGQEQWLAAIAAGILAAISAYRTKDTAEDPTKFQKQRALRKARQEWVDNQIEREKQQ